MEPALVGYEAAPAIDELSQINELRRRQTYEICMQWLNSTRNYGAIPQAVHWLTVFLVALAWALGVFDDALPKGQPRDLGLFVHISAGIAILALLVARVMWRFVDRAPLPEPTELGWIGPWLDRAARLGHLSLYILLVAVPVIGILLQFARGDALPLFGLAEIPSPWLKDRAFARSIKEVHEVLAHMLVILAIMHAAAALIHHWIFRDRTLARMLPNSDK